MQSSILSIFIIFISICLGLDTDVMSINIINLE